MKRLPQEKGKERTESHSKGELGAVAECGVIWAVDWRLSGESGVKLAHVLVRLLQWHKRIGSLKSSRTGSPARGSQQTKTKLALFHSI